MGIVFTRHGLSHISDSDQIPLEDIADVSSRIKSILGDFLTEFQPSDVSSLDFEIHDIALYLGGIDPMSIVDSAEQISSEYLLEAQAMVWLFEHEMFNRETFWAIWSYFFSEELSPFNSDEDELLIALFEEISIIFKSRLTEEEHRELTLQAQTPWLGASIAATKYQFSSEALILKKRTKLRES
jgi:hypothetical protein